MPKVKPVTLSITTEGRLALAETRVRKLEAELDNAKDVYLQLQGRVLRLELELSMLTPADHMRVTGSAA